ncbi:TIGR02391 family protein [Streptomyces sp. NPDC127190]|uniref:TIGR02391 family protein n=1 Tax=unclassified Streptomyces TaxID=2593676 RepID=UPI003639C219
MIGRPNLPKGMPRPTGAKGRILLSEIWRFFSQELRWPTFDDVDRALYAGGVDFEEAAGQLCPALLRGLDPDLSRVPQGNQELSLTIAGAANCADTGPAIGAFLLMVRTAARNEPRFRPSEPGGLPTLDPEDMSFAAVDAKLVSPRVPFMAASIALSEPCFRGGSRNCDTMHWTLCYDRGIRPFAGVSRLDDYWRIRKQVVGPARTVTEMLPFSKRPALPHATEIVALREHLVSALADSGPVAVPPTSMAVTCTLHPLIAEVAAERYDRGSYNDAVRAAFQAVEHRVQTLVGVHEIGERLMGFALGKPAPKITVTRSTGGSLESEQNGMQLLFKGAMLALRNPRSHGPDAKDDRDEADEMLAFASFLMRRLDIEDAEREKAAAADAESAP